MNTDASQSRRSFLKRFASALMVVRVASSAGAATVTASTRRSTATEPVSPPARVDDDGSLSAGDDMSDPGWSY